MTTGDALVAATTSEALTVNHEAQLNNELHRSAGVHALGMMSEGEFNGSLSTLITGLARLDRLIKHVMEEGVDVLTLPGVKEKVLSQAGAEKLCLMARLVPQYEVKRTLGERSDGAWAHPAVSYVVACNLHLGSSTGPIISQAVGASNSHETKHRWRTAQRACPECSAAGTLIKSKFTAGWLCFDKRGGCGATFAPNDERVTNQKLGMVENDSPLDLDNTLLKMACKRALVSAVKSATGGSARFTVDLDERVPRTEAVTASAVVVESEPTKGDDASLERTVAVDRLFALARRGGFEKRSDLYSHVAKRFGYQRVPTKMSEVRTEHITELVAELERSVAAAQEGVSA